MTYFTQKFFIQWTTSKIDKKFGTKNYSVDLTTGAPQTPAAALYTLILVCIRALPSICMCCLLTHTHTHTYIGDRAALTSRSKETCQRCPTTFINNSLNTESLHYIFQQREDKIAVFEVNSLIIKERRTDAHTRNFNSSLSLSLSLTNWQYLRKGFSDFYLLRGLDPPQCLWWLSPWSDMKICCGTVVQSVTFMV